MKSTLTAAVLLTVCVAAALGEMCNGKPSPNAQPNLYPVDSSAPVFVRSAPNAALYTVGQEGTSFNVVHVWGTPYEMGFAQGTLMHDEATDFIHSVYTYIEVQIEMAINGSKEGKMFPQWFVDDVALLGLDAALDLEIAATRLFTPSHFTEELHGLADATGIGFAKIERIHLLGELTKGSCSMFGATGAAVAPGVSLLQVRALDWDVDGPFQDFSQVTIYHPTSSEYGHAFANVGFTAFIGSFSGMSSVSTGTCEIGVAFPDDTFGKESRFGIPFTYLLRDLLQFDNSIADAQNRITNARRTCDLILGFGDGKANEFMGIQYSASVANYFTTAAGAVVPPVASWHPTFEDIVYFAMDWLCPGYDVVMAAQLEAGYGQLTAELGIRNITAITQTGNLFISYIDYASNSLYQSFYRPNSVTTGPLNAYDRNFVQLDMTAVFAVPNPDPSGSALPRALPAA